MGVSISQWRSAIGSHFYNSRDFKKNTPNISSLQSPKTTKKRICFTLLGILSIMIIVLYSATTLQTIETSQYKSTATLNSIVFSNTPSCKVLNSLPPWPPPRSASANWSSSILPPTQSSTSWPPSWSSSAVWEPTTLQPLSAFQPFQPPNSFQHPWLSSISTWPPSPSSISLPIPWSLSAAWSPTLQPSFWQSPTPSPYRHELWQHTLLLIYQFHLKSLPLQHPWSVSYQSQWLCTRTATLPSTRSSTCSPPYPTRSTPSSNMSAQSISDLQHQPTATTRLSSKKKNKLARSTNGNRQNRGMKLAHWNAGSAHLKNKMHEIEQVVSENHPHLLGISEANFKRGHDVEEVQLDDYDLILSKTIENDQLQVSRVVCYKHQSLVGKVREDLMSDQFSSIWLEIGLPGKKKILICQLYREWRYLGQPDKGEYSRSINEQMRRWVIFLDQWELAMASGKEVIVLGDCNLDLLKFDNAGVLQPLVDIMMQRVYPHGVVQCVQGPTHSWPGQVPSGLDHIYTNVAEKLSQVHIKGCGSSEHRLIINYCDKIFKEHKVLQEALI